jgi:hypothetical protein
MIPWIQKILLPAQSLRSFEAQPPARGAYTPEGMSQGAEEFQPQVGISSKPSVRTAGLCERYDPVYPACLAKAVVLATAG